MHHRTLGNTNVSLSPIAFGAFKIGRNVGIKYPKPYDLPDMAAVERLLNGVLDLGINCIDTAPAYGLSEERIGAAIAHRRREFILSTKVGETFRDGRSTYDFSAAAVRRSVHESLRRLRTDVIDIVTIHSSGDDLRIMNETDCLPAMRQLREEGAIRFLGLSGKTTQGAEAALAWADALMVEYHVEDTSHEAVIAQAKAKGVGIVVKKGLAAGRLPPETAIPFVLKNPGVASLVIGGLNVDHIRDNLRIAAAVNDV
jgi:aryl-alcohol dehydrogenase-like predicted oxidoreductase